jgi:hypothetical protein
MGALYEDDAVRVPRLSLLLHRLDRGREARPQDNRVKESTVKEMEIDIKMATVPMDPTKKFYQAYINPYNYFSYERVYQGHVYHPKPTSRLLCLSKHVPECLERPLLYFLYLPIFF